MTHITRPLYLLLPLLLMLLTGCPSNNGDDPTPLPPPSSPPITRVSINSAGVQGNGDSRDPAISQYGRYVAFESRAENFGNSVANRERHIYVQDKLTGTITLISVDSAKSSVGNAMSITPALAANGRYVAFASKADNLIADDTNEFQDIFIFDRDADNNGVFDEGGTDSTKTIRISVNSAGTQAADGDSELPKMSAAGRYVVFQSAATNLVSNDNNEIIDIFLHDRDVNGNRTFDEANDTSTTRISQPIDGTEEANGQSRNPSISGDGRYIAFDSPATNLVGNDTNAFSDIFVYDTRTSVLVRILVDDAGVEEGDGASNNPILSSDGRFVAFYSAATNLVPDDVNNFQDIFRHDRDADGNGTFDEISETRTTVSTVLVSVTSDGDQGDNLSIYADMALDGRYIVFVSRATNLVSTDIGQQDQDDVFLRDIQTGITRGISVANGGISGNSASYSVAISTDGKHIVFVSTATNLVSGDTNSYIDVFRTSNP